MLVLALVTLALDSQTLTWVTRPKLWKMVRYI